MSTVKVKEWVSGPGQYVEKSYTFAELRETFSEGDLVWSLLDEVERLRTGSIHSCHDRCPRIECVQRREIERLRADAERYRWLRKDQHEVGSWPSFLPPNKFDQWVDEGRLSSPTPAALWDRECVRCGHKWNESVLGTTACPKCERAPVPQPEQRRR